ncbi:hypothetical protein D0Z07_0826 [Hyphodiscus hymeniophilus]|uniref:DUF7907 domain-containing protein n=1 Tax=Hyphodiscus hymeniophilus TaxID=353542 RepID=A0A9P7B065_9HELO|nr:hypothetical protein D0Z07_0826 [Hyphodiscus hymeniophilus]
MLSLRNLAITASAILGATAAPAEIASRQTFTPGTLNNTQEFYITLQTTDGCISQYNGWQVEAYHTGAGLADPVFATAGSPAYLNGTNLQFDVNAFPFGVNALPGDTNYARWEPVTIAAGYGSGEFATDGDNGLISTDEEFGGWIVCEWYHDINAPQLFQLIKGFATEPTVLPDSCANAILTLDYF